MMKRQWTKAQWAVGGAAVGIFVGSFLTGCASQSLPPFIHAEPSELSACATAPTGCSVWTDEELTSVMTEIMGRAIQYGRQLERGSL